MAKIDVQSWPVVLESSASLVASGSISGCAHAAGYAYIVGMVFISASTTTGSAIRVSQSADGGSNWDAWDSFNITADSGSMFSASIHGNAVRVDVRCGATAASTMRTLWQLRPV